MTPFSTASLTVMVTGSQVVLGIRSRVSSSISWNLGQSLSSGSTKSSTSIWLNSLILIMPWRGAISFL